MGRYTSSIAALIAFGALSAAAAADPAASPSLPAAAATAAQKAPAPQTTPPSARRVICLNVSVQCFTAKTAATTASAKAFDLSAPDIRRLYSEAELRSPLEDPYEEMQRLKEQQVKVEGARPDPNLPIGILSLPWAVMHPTQAWRIFMPVPSAK